jgi:hypothetical protein
MSKHRGSKRNVGVRNYLQELATRDKLTPKGTGSGQIIRNRPEKVSLGFVK